MQKNRIVTIVLILIVIFLNVACDQGTKDYARKNFKSLGEIQVVGRFFVIRYAENQGAFLSMGADLPEPVRFALLTLFPAVMLTVLFVYVLRSKTLSLFETICISSVIGGGMSNIFDRFMNRGIVSDFLNFGVFDIRTGILNFADLSVTFGAILLLLAYLARKKVTPVQTR